MKLETSDLSRASEGLGIRDPLHSRSNKIIFWDFAHHDDIYKIS